MILFFFFIMAFKTYALTSLEVGQAPYDPRFPVLSKIKAIEGAIQIALIKHGGFVSSGYLVKNELLVQSYLSLNRNAELKGIHVENCSINKQISCRVKVNLSKPTRAQSMPAFTGNLVSCGQIKALKSQTIYTCWEDLGLFFRFKIMRGEKETRVDIATKSMKVIGLGRNKEESRHKQMLHFFHRWLTSREISILLASEESMEYLHFKSKGAANKWLKEEAPIRLLWPVQHYLIKGGSLLKVKRLDSLSLGDFK